MRRQSDNDLLIKALRLDGKAHKNRGIGTLTTWLVVLAIALMLAHALAQ